MDHSMAAGPLSLSLCVPGDTDSPREHLELCTCILGTCAVTHFLWGEVRWEPDWLLCSHPSPLTHQAKPKRSLMMAHGPGEEKVGNKNGEDEEFHELSHSNSVGGWIFS